MALTNTAQTVFSVTIVGSTETIIMDNDDIRELYFIEDIYSYLKTGKMICRDTRGLAEFLPIVGNERIFIEYATVIKGKNDRVVKELEFVIVKVEEIENTNDKRRHFLSFFFIEEPHRNLHMAHHSVSYMCELYTDMIEHILADHVGITDFTDFEPCVEKLHYFYTGLKTPAQCIEWLGSRCSGAGSGQPGYLLFSSTKNPGVPYNFITLENLLMQRTQMPPYAGPYTIGSHHEYNVNRILKYYNGRVDKRGLEKLMYYINLGFDIQRKKYLRNEYFYTEALDRFTCLGDFSLFEEGIDTPISVNQELTGEFEEEEIMKNIYFGDWIKRYCLQNLATVIIEGHSERHCGGMIEVMWPSSNDEELFDKNMNGLFLVKSITHMFNPLQKPVYTQKMVLIKNAYNDSEGNLTKAGKVNKKLVHIERSTFDNINVRGL